MVLLTLLAVVTVAIIRQRSLIGVVILAGIYSFLMASVMIVLDAVDVEAAVRIAFARGGFDFRARYGRQQPDGNDDDGLPR